MQQDIDPAALLPDLLDDRRDTPALSLRSTLKYHCALPGAAWTALIRCEGCMRTFESCKFLLN